MSRLITLLFITSFSFGQGYDFQQLCLDCVEQNGFFCGDDPANWTQYAPDGCVQTDWIVDGWEDCVDESEEAEGYETTSILDCSLKNFLQLSIISLCFIIISSFQKKKNWWRWRESNPRPEHLK